MSLLKWSKGGNPMRGQCVLVAAVVAGSPCAGQNLRYVAVDLGRLAGAFNAVPVGIASDNTVVGWAQGPQTAMRGFIVRPGQPIEEMPPIPGFAFNQPTD